MTLLDSIKKHFILPVEVLTLTLTQLESNAVSEATKKQIEILPLDNEKVAHAIQSILTLQKPLAKVNILTATSETIQKRHIEHIFSNIDINEPKIHIAKTLVQSLIMSVFGQDLGEFPQRVSAVIKVLKECKTAKESLDFHTFMKTKRIDNFLDEKEISSLKIDSTKIANAFQKMWQDFKAQESEI